MLSHLVKSRFLSGALLAVATLFITAQSASAQILRSEDKFAEVSSGGFAYHTGGGIKSYPNISKYIGENLSAITKLDGNFTAVTPSGGAWAVTYDIWNSSKSEEVMLWFNYTGTSTGGGNVKPISSSYDASGNARAVATNVNVGGSTWNVFRGKNGANVTTFLRTTKTNSSYVDTRAILNWIRSQGWFGDIHVGDIQHGFEITSCGSSSTNRVEFKFTQYNLWR
jgi:hypothetical protein